VPEELVLLNRQDAKDAKKEEGRRRKKQIICYREGSKRTAKTPRTPRKKRGFLRVLSYQF
jgi:hypothetical protein